MADSWRALSENSTFAGNFRVVRALDGATPRRALYLAEHTGTARQCALRVLDPALVAAAAGKARFEELRSLRSRVKSDHVVDVVAAGIDRTTGSPWFALDHLDGESLDAHAEHPLPADETMEVMLQLSHGLAAVHAAGQVHGTLDPASVMVAASYYSGSPYTVTLLDFWTAAWLRSADANADSTSVAALFWRAPEQTESGVTVTAKADVWAFGLVAFRLLTGKLYWKSAADPSQATPVAVMKEVSVSDMQRASRRAEALGVEVSLPDGFDDWFARCVARDPDDRFATITDAVEALEPVLDAAEVVTAAPATPPPAASRLAKAVKGWTRTPDFMVPATLALLIAVAFGVRTYVRSKWKRVRPRAAVAAVVAEPTVVRPTTTATPDAGPQPVTLTEAGAAAMATRLGGATRGSPVWISVAAADPAAEALATRLLAIFERAGWQTHPLQHSQVRARPGIFLFAAEEQSPPYLETVERALTDAQFHPTVARGYRAFYREMVRDNPNYRGFQLADDQTYLIVVGRGQ